MKMFVLDDADEMLSRGFEDQIYDIFRLLPSTTQVVLLSATMPAEVLEVSRPRNVRFTCFRGCVGAHAGQACVHVSGGVAQGSCCGLVCR